MAKPALDAENAKADTRSLRSAIRGGLKLRLQYRSQAGEVTSRTVWPVVLGYADTHCLLIAWCEEKQAFRHFRTDRVLNVEVLTETIGVSKSNLRRRWERWREAELGRGPR